MGVQCMVTKGDVPVNITWYLNEGSIKNVKGVTITSIGHKSSSLSIESLTSAHKGVYTCYATNLAGRTQYSSELAVNGKHMSIFSVVFSLLRLPNFELVYFNR